MNRSDFKKLINNKKISKFAISIIEKLKRNKYQGYLVGGCVRDLLCGIEPKDFDIATNATPDQVRKVFKASRIIVVIESKVLSASALL